MSALRAIAGEIAGLFVDDGFLALATLAVVALAALAAEWSHAGAAAILIGGCFIALIASIWRAAGAKRRR